MSVIIVVLAAWGVLSVAAGLFAGAFIRAGHGPDIPGSSEGEGS